MRSKSNQYQHTVKDIQLPISEPHWLAGTISRIGICVLPPGPSLNCEHHSSNFRVMRENALKIAFVEPDTVTIRSGHDPSEMFIFAPDCKDNICKNKSVN